MDEDGSRPLLDRLEPHCLRDAHVHTRTEITICGGPFDVGQNGRVRMSIVGFNLPGREFCRPDGSVMSNVHVGVQLRREPVDLVRADSAEVRWDLDVGVVEHEGALDFRGPVVQGRRGERFVYLTWGEVHPGGGFEMFRRAKLMLNRIDPDVVRAALAADGLEARVDLTGGDGGPRCARVDPPAIVWSTTGD